MDLLTIEQVAQRLACSDDQVRVLINSGQLNYVNIGTGNVRRCVRISGDALHEFIRSRQAVAKSPAESKRRLKPKPRRDWV